LIKINPTAEKSTAVQWRSRTFGRLVRWSNLPHCCLRFWEMDSLFKASRTNAWSNMQCLQYPS